jgi:hypothetical protein
MSQFNGVTGGLMMDAREGFCIAVKFYRSGDWNPGLPDQITIEVDGDALTLRQVCGRIGDVAERLPRSVVSDLTTSLHEKHPKLAEKLVTDRTYALAATCLLCLMDEGESAIRLPAA